MVGSPLPHGHGMPGRRHIGMPRGQHGDVISETKRFVTRLGASFPHPEQSVASFPSRRRGSKAVAVIVVARNVGEDRLQMRVP